MNGDNRQTMKPKDTLAPRGAIPILSRWLGSLWVGYSILAGLAGIYWAWERGSQRYPPLELILRLLPGAFSFALVVVSLSLPGLIFAGLFPSINITHQGIEYRYLFVKGLIRWSEIETVARVKWPTQCLALVISRSFPLLRGLWMPSLHGQMTGIWKPVLLLSTDWEHRDEWFQAVRQQQAVLSVQTDAGPVAH